MVILDKKAKVIAAILALALAGGLAFLPRGELGKASRMIKQGNYAQAIEVLLPLSQQQGQERKVHLLLVQALEGLVEEGQCFQAITYLESHYGKSGRNLRPDLQLVLFRARTGLGQLTGAQALLAPLYEGIPSQGLKKATLDFIRTSFEADAWILAVEGWYYLVNAGFTPPEEEFQLHLGLGGVMAWGMEPNLVNFILAHQQASHPLTGLAALPAPWIIGQDEALAGVQFLQSVEWGQYSRLVRYIAGHRLGVFYLNLLASSAVEAKTLLGAELDYLLWACWTYIDTQYHHFTWTQGFQGSREDFYQKILQSPENFTVSDPLLKAAGKVWQEAQAGKLNHTGSEVALYLSDAYREEYSLAETHSLSLLPTGNLKWSADGTYLAVPYSDSQANNRFAIDVIEYSTGKSVASIPGDRFIWAPQGHSFLVHRDLIWEAFPAPQEKATQLGNLPLLGWWHENLFLGQDGLVYSWERRLHRDPSLVLVADDRYKLSPTGLVMVWADEYAVVYDSAGRKLTALGAGIMGGDIVWSPSGKQLLAGEKIIKEEGSWFLELPLGSATLGWLDEEHILVRRILGCPARYYSYNLTTGRIIYLPELETHEVYPRGDGKTIAWAIEGEVFIGQLKASD